MNLTDYLKEDDIFVCNEYPTTDQFYAKFAAFLKSRERINDAEKVKRLFIRRENIQSTAIGKGAAAPHIFSDEFKEFFISAALIRKGMDFKAPDGQPVFLVFLIMSDERDVGFHLKSLAHIARMVNDTEIVVRLRDAQTAQEAFQALTEEEHLFQT